jgi:ribosomal protein S18 acetylase RimI-like enzyme
MPAAADVTIRIASLADVQALAGAHVASWRETYAGMMPDELLASLSVDARAAMWTKVLDEPLTPASTVVYVAELENRIAGFGSCGAQRTEALKQRFYDGEIIAIYVLKAFQRHAIGRKLLSALASHLSQSGFAAASLWVLRDNTPARQFYERYGAQVIAEREDVRKDAVLSEVAYGWTRLPELARITAPQAGNTRR